MDAKASLTPSDLAPSRLQHDVPCKYSCHRTKTYLLYRRRVDWAKTFESLSACEFAFEVEAGQHCSQIGLVNAKKANTRTDLIFVAGTTGCGETNSVLWRCFGLQKSYTFVIFLNFSGQNVHLYGEKFRKKSCLWRKWQI